MSARNRDKSGFNRDRNQRVAQPKHNRELPSRAAKGSNPADNAVTTRPRPVSA